jgi:DNA-binding protein YbaB
MIDDEKIEQIEDLIFDALNDAYAQGARRHGLDLRAETITDRILSILAEGD